MKKILKKVSWFFVTFGPFCLIMVKLKNMALALLFLILASFYPVDTKLVYPAVKMDETEVDVHFGKKVPNPYKWLTNASDTENEQFMKQQTNLTTTYLAKISAEHRKTIKKYMKINSYERSPEFLPTVKVGDKYFFFETTQSNVFFQRNQTDKPTIVLSNKPNDHTVEWLIAAMPSPSGNTLAYSFSARRSSREPILLNTYHFRNVATGKDLNDVLYNVSSSTLNHPGELSQWSIDGSGIFYLSNTSTPSAAKVEPSKDQKMYIFYHAIGTKQTDDILLAELPSIFISGLTLTEDGQYLVAVYDATFEDEMRREFYGERATTKKKGFIYYLELCARGKAPCKPTKENKLKMTRIDIADNRFRFVGSKDDQFYINHWSDGKTFHRIIQLDLSKPTQKDWKTLVSINPSEGNIGDARIAKSEFLLVAYWSHLSHTTRMDVHKLSNISDVKNVPVQYGRFRGLFLGRNDTKVVYHMTSILSSREVYLVDLATLSPEKIVLPGYPDDPYRDGIVTTEAKYTVNQGGDQMPIIIMHGKNLKKDGKSPTLMLLEPEYFEQEQSHRLIIPFMKTFNGVVAIARIPLPPEHSYRPNNVSIQSTEAAIEFLVKEKYTDKAHLTVIPGHVEFSSLLAAVINRKPNTCGAALFVDANVPALGNVMSWAKEYPKHSYRNLDLTPHFKDKASTEEYLKVSPLHNIKASKSKNIQYPAVLLIDDGCSDEKRYISELQHQIGSSSQQVNPLLAKFPVRQPKWRNHEEDAEVEQYVDVFSFLALSVNYTVTK